MSVPRAQQESSTTPPTSFTKPPLTPPPSEQKPGTSVVDIIREIENRRSCRESFTKPWLCYNLSPHAYKHLEERLRTDEFAEDKLRFDYFPSANLFVLRMPSVLHEAIKSSIGDDIVEQLRSIARGAGPAADFAQSIKRVGSASITFNDPEFGKHEPDDSFEHVDAQYPGVIIELSYSQKRRDLARLADDYILGSNGDIRVMIGIDIDYKDRSTTLSMWRPRIQLNNAGEEELVAYRTLSDQEFRQSNGIPNGNPQAGLRLRLDDFATQALVSQQPTLGKEIFISSTTLCAYLREAEACESKSKQRTGVTQALTPGVKRRRRQSTPPEQLHSDDEHRFREDEKRAAKLSQRDDSSYRGSLAS